MGVPFAREYGGTLANRSFGGAQVSRTFYARGQTGQQLLLGVYAALERQIGAGKVKMFPRTEMLDLVVDERPRASASSCATSSPARSRSHSAHAVVLATGGYGNVFYLSTNAKGCNVTATYRAYKRGAGFANPCFTQIHPTCIPVAATTSRKLTLMSRVAAQRRPRLGAEDATTTSASIPTRSPTTSATTTSSASQELGISVPLPSSKSGPL